MNSRTLSALRASQQFRLPALSRGQNSRLLGMLDATRPIAPELVDWMREVVCDDLADQLESYTTSGEAWRDAPRETPFHEIPRRWPNEVLARALIWCQVCSYGVRDVWIGRWVDVITRQVTVAVVARLTPLKKKEEANHAAGR